MCTVTLAIMGVTTALETFREYQNANYEKAYGNYKSQLLIQQANQARKNAAYEMQEGIEESRNQKLQSILNMGKVKSKIASGNIALSSQTALNLVDDEKLNGELSALNTLKVSQRRSDAYLQQTGQYYSNAQLNSFNNKNNYKNNLFSAATCLLDTGSGLYNKSMNINKK